MCKCKKQITIKKKLLCSTVFTMPIKSHSKQAQNKTAMMQFNTIYVKIPFLWVVWQVVSVRRTSKFLPCFALCSCYEMCLACNLVCHSPSPKLLYRFLIFVIFFIGYYFNGLYQHVGLVFVGKCIFYFVYSIYGMI